jgi:S1-C subfamily serine protease
MRQSVELVVAELGEKTREDYVAMTQGKLIEPPENSFGPCLRPVPARYRDFELGFDEMRLGVVSDLESASAAAAAGVKEGDIIHTHTPLAEVRSSPDAELTLELERDSERLTIGLRPARRARGRMGLGA